MKIRAIAPWFGSKRNLSPRIVAALGPHRAYWEPFCGSMAVLLSKEPATYEVVNDLHGDLINLARVIQHGRWGPDLYRRLRRTLVNEDLFYQAAEILSSDWRTAAGEDPEADVGRAYWYFVVSWLGRNGIAGTNVGGKRGAGHSFCVRYTSNGGSPGTRFRSAILSIPAWQRRLAQVTILRRDAFEILGKIDDAPGTAIYVDPPYLSHTRTGFEAGGGLSRYVHDFVPDDHGRLAGLLRRFTRARVVVSYYGHPDLAGLYPGWTQIDCTVSKSLSVAQRKGAVARTAPEVLIVNKPEHQGDMFLEEGA